MKIEESEQETRRPASQAFRIGNKPIGFKVARGVVSSVLRKIIVAPISLFLVPFTLWKLGVVGFGIYTILATIINLAWLMDPGLGATVTKYVAESSATNDIAGIRRLLNASCAICLAMAVVASCLMWAFPHAIIKELFRGPSAPPAVQILSLWPLVTVCIVAFLMTMPFLAFIDGRQRMDLTNVLIVSAELLSSAMTVVLLLAGEAIRGLLIARLLGSLFILVGGIVISRRLMPSFVPNPFRCEWREIRKIFAFSMPLYAGYVLGTLQGQLEGLYLARLVGVVPVGWYSVASQGAAKVKRVPDMLLGPIVAGVSELDAAGESRKLEELHFRALKYIALVATPLAVFAVVDARMLIHLWVGNRLGVIALTFAILVIGNFFPQGAQPTYLTMVGRGILRPAVYASIMVCVLNVALSFFFIRRWGFAGAAYGTAIPVILGTVYYLAQCRRYFQRSLYRTLLRAYLKPLLCSTTAACCVLAIALLKLRLWEELAIEVVVFGIVYMGGLVLTRSIDAFDLATAMAHVPFFSRFGAALESLDTTGH